jgi:dihydrofolate reductase
MRKLFLFNLISLDGFFEGPNRELDWHNVDAEFNDFAIGQLDSIDLILFGRITYEMMASFWPTETAIKLILRLRAG